MDIPNSILVQPLSLGGKSPVVVIKDSIDIKGTATRLGSEAFFAAPTATQNAEIVERLLVGGAKIIGKANMHELAFGVTGVNDWTGTPLNTRYPKLIPGGSSSGSATAITSRLADIGIGTDTGGSIRIPAACCGVFGLKPTFGRISRRGVHPEHSSLDCVGPIADHVAGIVHAMNLIDPTFRWDAHCRVATLGVIDVEAEPQITQAVELLLEKANVRLLRIRLASFVDAYEAAQTIIGSETIAAYRTLINSESIAADVRTRLREASTIERDKLDWAEELRRRFARQVDSALQIVDALALPTLPIVPPALADLPDAQTALRLSALVRQFNLSGHPAMTIPTETVNGLPAGLQIVGSRGGDEDLCAIAGMIEVAILNRGHEWTKSEIRAHTSSSRP